MLMATTQSSFDIGDIKDDLDDAPVKGRETNVKVYTETCPKCNGSGRYFAPSSHGTRCFACDGKGTLSFRTSREQRERARAKAAAKKVSKAEKNLADFEEEHPEIAAWWTGSDFGFAIAMRDAVTKWGHLTENQMSATLRCIEKFNAAKVAREAANATQEAIKVQAPSVDVSKIETAFKRGQANDIKRPKLRLLDGGNSFVFSLAGPNSRNAGSIYVTMGDDYMGKITDGKFIRANACPTAIEASVVAACIAPLQSAVAYGRRFGTCSCCGRELTNHESIDLGIGPICREKFF